MPLADASFSDQLGRLDSNALLLFGPTLRVFASHYVEDSRSGVHPTQTVEALIDTGAAQSCINVKLAESLGLPLVDTIEMGGVGGSGTHNLCIA